MPCEPHISHLFPGGEVHSLGAQWTTPCSTGFYMVFQSHLESGVLPCWIANLPATGATGNSNADSQVCFNIVYDVLQKRIDCHEGISSAEESTHTFTSSSIVVCSILLASIWAVMLSFFLVHQQKVDNRSCWKLFVNASSICINIVVDSNPWSQCIESDHPLYS